MKDQDAVENMVRERLEEIKPVPPRDPHAASRGRAQFLGMAVSASEFQRRKGWKSIFRKEQYAMNILLSILVIAGLLFGGGATAVGAAQDDLPNEPLYALKVWSEDVSLQLRSDPEVKVERLMELAQVRIQEMTQIMENGQTPPDQIRLRLEQHIHQALQICNSMDDAALDRTLLKLRDRLQQQDRIMEQLQTRANPDALPILERTREMLRLRLQLVEEGLLNHEMFRYTIQNGFQFGQDDDFTPPAQNGNGTQNQNGQPATQPGGNDNGSGPGPNPDSGGPNTAPGGPNTTPGGSNTTPGGPNTDPGGNNNDSGSGGSNGNNNDGGSGGTGSGGNKP